MSLARRLREAREAASLTLEELAEQAEVSKTYLWELEKDQAGEKKPSADVLLRIANALSVTLAELLGLPTVQIKEKRTVLSKSLLEFKERMAQVLQHVDEFQSAELGLVATAKDGAATGVPPRVHYEKDGVATFDAPVERVFEYMRAGNHPHRAFKSHRLLGIAGNVVTVAVEAYDPDGSTTELTVEHRLDPPSEIVTTMAGGHFDGARFVHSYTALGDRTKVDLVGDFPALLGISEADELAMIDGFFTMVFSEDAETLRTWSPNAH